MLSHLVFDVHKRITTKGQLYHCGAHTSEFSTPVDNNSSQRHRRDFGPVNYYFYYCVNAGLLKSSQTVSTKDRLFSVYLLISLY